MQDFDEFDGSDFLEEPKEYPRDKVIDDARETLEEHFSQHQKSVFYLKQLQVIFERRFYHWITSKAINELVAEGRLRQEFGILRQNQKTEATLVKFIFNPSCRYTKRPIRRKLNIIRRFSTEEVGRACGRHAEILFSRALMSKDFKMVAENAQQYQGQKWTQSNHNLDFIFERDGLAYGCEIKNRFEYINQNEMLTKIQMCSHLGLTPLFILRMAPKNYIWQIREAGGFTKIFVAHIYPYGMDTLVNEIREELHGLPVDCPKDLPNTILDTFLRWHQKKTNE